MYDSVTNHTTYLGNTTETYFRITSLMIGHNYTFSVQARCLLNGQLCGEPALLLYNQLTAGTEWKPCCVTHHSYVNAEQSSFLLPRGQRCLPQ